MRIGDCAVQGFARRKTGKNLKGAIAEVFKIVDIEKLLKRFQRRELPLFQVFDLKGSVSGLNHAVGDHDILHRDEERYKLPVTGGEFGESALVLDTVIDEQGETFLEEMGVLLQNGLKIAEGDFGAAFKAGHAPEREAGEVIGEMVDVDLAMVAQPVFGNIGMDDLPRSGGANPPFTDFIGVKFFRDTELSQGFIKGGEREEGDPVAENLKIDGDEGPRFEDWIGCISADDLNLRCGELKWMLRTAEFQKGRRTWMNIAFPVIELLDRNSEPSEDSVSPFSVRECSGDGRGELFGNADDLLLLFRKQFFMSFDLMEGVEKKPVDVKKRSYNWIEMVMRDELADHLSVCGRESGIIRSDNSGGISPLPVVACCVRDDFEDVGWEDAHSIEVDDFGVV
jgi:hypothetical protein